MIGPLLRAFTAMALVLASYPVLAHHSDSMYDLERLITIRGVLTGVKWSNPHVELQLEGVDESGESVTSVIEMMWPSALARMGLSQDSFATGELVEIQGNPSREPGRIVAWGRTFVREDGTRLELPPKPNWIEL